ncbi:ABC transporter ATP-binding protein [Nocardioides seonyuensis]|uniref:ABC transporter ATP-binding protein n=1 Tax=Nocardioides seonyuensis TaxID=2518371 RepID=A0A4V1BLV9_9ACTN|nr:ABC transporter ATP-binding protein [Nocardioides seonyuensis]QBX54232.1 ABC transporter ATP-binding protein [Nocardioides seonyuensis]
MSTISVEAASVRVPTAEGDRTILFETTLRITEHRVALIGANGSGKSTLARLLNGLVEPTSGRVVVDGLDTMRDGRQVRRKVGFVFTDPASQLVMPTAAEDVALSLRRTHPHKSARLAAAEAVLSDFGLAGFGPRSVHGLSGGERQMLALAGVLATGPEILVADEPTTLLDLSNSRRIGDLLLSLPQQLVLVTHDLDLAARCDRAILVADGRVQHDGDAQNVVDHYRATA